MRIRKRRKSSNFLILILIILLLGISVGYAAFADTLNIVGTANANGKFNVEFTIAVSSEADAAMENITKYTVKL